MSVLETTVDRGFCCGCGVCAGICQTLKMEFNQYGEYNPVKIHECKDCGLCTKVCPFFDGNPNEDELGDILFSTIPDIHHRTETGYYLSSGVGSVSDMNHRMASASGGVATWFLEELLRKNIVDAVISVEHSDDKKRLFRFFISTTPDEVRRGSGSAYYPVEISEMLYMIMAEDKRYAIISLPCLIKGLRLAAEKIPKLQKRIVLIAGLACYHMTSTKFTDYAAYLSGLQEEVTSVSYRCKSLSVPPVFSKFTFTGVNGTVAEYKFLHQMFGSRFCSLRACECCDDMHAELADITFMDAWLPEYANEPRGTSLYIARSPLAEKIMQGGRVSRELDIELISIDKVIKAQGAIRWKRELLSYRLSLMKERGWKPPTKRVSPSMGENLSIIERDECRKCLDIFEKSREMILEGYAEAGTWFDSEIADRPYLISAYRKLYHLSLMTKAIPAYLWRRIKEIAPPTNNHHESSSLRFPNPMYHTGGI